MKKDELMDTLISHVRHNMLRPEYKLRLILLYLFCMRNIKEEQRFVFCLADSNSPARI